MPGKKYPISNAAGSGASDPCVALRSMDCAYSLRSVPASAFAGSVAPISVRHFLIASVASSTMTTAGPADERTGNPRGGGVDAEGLPDDPVATAEDEIGANEDETEG